MLGQSYDDNIDVVLLPNHALNVLWKLVRPQDNDAPLHGRTELHASELGGSHFGFADLPELANAFNQSVLQEVLLLHDVRVEKEDVVEKVVDVLPLQLAVHPHGLQLQVVLVADGLQPEHVRPSHVVEDLQHESVGAPQVRVRAKAGVEDKVDGSVLHLETVQDFRQAV